MVEGEGAVLGVNLRRLIVTNGDFATRLFPISLLWTGLVNQYHHFCDVIHLFRCDAAHHRSPTACLAGRYRGLLHSRRFLELCAR